MQERHAQSPALGEAIQLDAGDTLEGDPGDDALDSGYVPPDRPSGMGRSGLTTAEEIEGESLDDRLRQETDTDDDALDDTRAGRLVADDEGVRSDTTAELAADDVGIDGGAASAEEAAVHTINDPEA
ncbi:MAG TPA: DUF5709 domain-containing protein [Mycobacteriales bacterium]|nr:DUF5709 domain-containing protein [Mycobacteriales bacterium]